MFLKIILSPKYNLIGLLNINVIDTITNQSYKSLWSGLIVLGDSGNSLFKLQNNLIYLGFDQPSAIIRFELDTQIYDTNYNFIDVSYNEINSFYISGTQLQTNIQSYNNYIHSLISTFNQEYIVSPSPIPIPIPNPIPNPIPITIPIPIPNPIPESNNNLLIGIIICIIIILIIIWIVIIYKRRVIEKK